MPSFKQMDLDAFTAARREDWMRLAQLASRWRYSGRESDELINRYQAGASDLSAIRTNIGPSSQGENLSLSLSTVRRGFTGASVNVLEQLSSFFAYQLPAALFRVRWITVAIAAGTFLIAAILGAWLDANPSYLLHLGTASDLKTYADQSFVSYYSAHPDAAFAGQVWTHNATLTAICIASGITGVFPIYFLMQNAVELGEASAIVTQYGTADHFYLYIAPHGQLELYSVFTGGAAGLLIFWAWVAPRGRTRLEALAQDGRAMFTIVIGLIISLAMSGTIEGYVTRQAWPWPIKIGLGTLALAIFLVYQWVIGRRAFRLGATGDLSEFEGGARQLVAS
jgi:uncharacterized membrane protein SpoIIM required for sporulation